jgi:hypothetical protein
MRPGAEEARRECAFLSGCALESEINGLARAPKIRSEKRGGNGG